MNQVKHTIYKSIFKFDSKHLTFEDKLDFAISYLRINIDREFDKIFFLKKTEVKQ